MRRRAAFASGLLHAIYIKIAGRIQTVFSCILTFFIRVNFIQIGDYFTYLVVTDHIPAATALEIDDKHFWIGR